MATYDPRDFIPRNADAVAGFLGVPNQPAAPSVIDETYISNRNPGVQIRTRIIVRIEMPDGDALVERVLEEIEKGQLPPLTVKRLQDALHQHVRTKALHRAIRQS